MPEKGDSAKRNPGEAGVGGLKGQWIPQWQLRQFMTGHFFERTMLAVTG